MHYSLSYLDRQKKIIEKHCIDLLIVIIINLKKYQKATDMIIFIDLSKIFVHV